jgi:glycosyltransferase involved in cell wall biosynthesis
MVLKKLRILQIVPYYYPAWAYGGIPRVVYELSTELSSRGHSVIVFTTDVLDRAFRSPYSGTEADIKGVRTRYFRNISNILAYDYQFYLPIGMSKSIREVVEESDIIHMHGHRNFLNNMTHNAARRLNKRYIFSAHGTAIPIERRVLIKRVFDIIFGNRILRDAKRLIAVSQNEVEQYEAMGITSDRVSVVYNGIDITAFQALPEKGTFRRKYGLEEKKIILFLGKITPRKGVDFLVRAYSLLKRNNIVLVIAGNDMGHKPEVERLIAEMNLRGKVIFTGLLVDDEKLAAYQDADVLVYPSMYEIFGLVPFEAMLCGTPVIVSDDCGCGELIRREGIGKVIRYNDDRGLRDAIDEVLQEPAHSNKMTLRGRQFIIQNLSWGIITKQYEDVYYNSITSTRHN